VRFYAAATAIPWCWQSEGRWKSRSTTPFVLTPPRCPVEFEPIRTHFARRRPNCLRNIVAVSSPAALSPATVPGLFGGGSVSLLRTAH